MITNQLILNLLRIKDVKSNLGSHFLTLYLYYILSMLPV